MDEKKISEICHEIRNALQVIKNHCKQWKTRELDGANVIGKIAERCGELEEALERLIASASATPGPDSERKIEITPYDLAQRFIGIGEVPGSTANPQILAMLRLDQEWPKDDDVPWCSAFVNYVAWLLRLPRSKNLLARSWLQVGRPKNIDEAEIGFDVVILQRGAGKQPGPEIIEAPGHVGFFAGREAGQGLILGGNQSNTVNVSRCPDDRILGVRRLI